MMRLAKGKRSACTLLAWAALVGVLAAIAYVAGAVLARRWMTPSLALPRTVPSPQAPSTSATPIGPGEPVEGTLGAQTLDEWQFWCRAGQSATIEMWFHPGSGSSVEAELMIRLIAPNGTALAEKEGTVFLPPYLLQSSLPETGTYRLQVVPVSGSPGRYSLNLSLSSELGQTTPWATTISPTRAPMGGSPAVDSTRVADSLQLQWPTVRRAISGWTFHDPANPAHIGLDIAANEWDPIVAVADGEVVFAEWGGGYGNLVILAHAGGWSSYYAHLTEIAVDTGQQVHQGETLGGAGTTGYSTGPHLHFELRYRGRPVDPHVHLP